eukprot:m.209481 g.209481  ORF g.209481 m.209481 type:complete len:154 (+) comp15046_c0_seq2:633-1094(+)
MAEPTTKLAKTGPTVVEGFTKAIMECELQDFQWHSDVGDNPHLRFAELPEPFAWLSLPFKSRHTLFIRHHYEHVWQHVLKSLKPYIEGDEVHVEHERCLLLGQPGIGKSAAANYFLIRALQEGHSVLYETALKRQCFHPTALMPKLNHWMVTL